MDQFMISLSYQPREVGLIANLQIRKLWCRQSKTQQTIKSTVKSQTHDLYPAFTPPRHCQGPREPPRESLSG